MRQLRPLEDFFLFLGGLQARQSPSPPLDAERPRGPDAFAKLASQRVAGFIVQSVCTFFGSPAPLGLEISKLNQARPTLVLREVATMRVLGSYKRKWITVEALEARRSRRAEAGTEPIRSPRVWGGSTDPAPRSTSKDRGVGWHVCRERGSQPGRWRRPKNRLTRRAAVSAQPP